MIKLTTLQINPTFHHVLTGTKPSANNTGFRALANWVIEPKKFVQRSKEKIAIIDGTLRSIAIFKNIGNKAKI